MAPAFIVGLIYYGIMFGFAFIVGVARTLVIAPRIGESSAVLLEIPIVVAVSWVVARYLLRSRSFTLSQCVVIGATAFTLTMASEMVLAQLLRGQRINEWAMSVVTPLGLVGLAGQIIFASIPMLFKRPPRRS